MDYGALALEAHKQDRLADAVNYYRLHLAQQPNSAIGWLAFGMLLHMKIGDVRAAMDCYRRSLELVPDNAAAHQHLGTLLALNDLNDEAVVHLKQSIAQGPNSGTAVYAELACVYLRLGQIDAASDVAAACRAKHPDDFFPPYLQAFFAHKRGAFDEAVSYLADTVALDPRFPIPLGLRGLSLALAGRLDEARRNLQEMTEIQASHVAAGVSPEEFVAANRLWRDVRRDAKNQLGIEQTKSANFVMLFGGMGDQFFMASILPQFKAANPDHPLVAVCTPRARWDMLFPEAADLFYRLDSEQIRRLMVCNRFFPDHPYTAFFPWLGPMISLVTITQNIKYIFGLPQSAPCARPTIPEAVKQKSLEMFRELGGKPGRSVLISNLSNSNPMNGDGWWRALAGELHQAGFVVFQNMTNMWSANPKDVLTPAIPVDLPVENVIPFCEAGGFFIGIRSGLCDLLGFAQASMKAIHVKRRYATNSRYPISVWLDHNTGFSLRRCFDNDRWQDIEITGDATFDPALVADWTTQTPPGR